METQDLLQKINQLSSNLKVSFDSIEKELIEQAQIFFEVGQLYAYTLANRDACKADLEENDAILATNLRQDSTTAGTKITEGRIEEFVTSHPQHKSLTDACINAKLIADKAQALRDAFSQRCSMLRDLVTLQTSGFINSGTPTGLNRSYQEARERLQEARKIHNS